MILEAFKRIMKFNNRFLHLNAKPIFLNLNWVLYAAQEMYFMIVYTYDDDKYLIKIHTNFTEMLFTFNNLSREITLQE